MKEKQKSCPACGNENINEGMKQCPNCKAKLSKPFYKKWWFWVIVVIVISIGASGANSGSSSNSGSTSSSNVENSVSEVNNQYEKVELQQMIDDLDQNALKAEKNYQNKYIEFSAKISSFDSDGSYVSVEAVNASDFNLDTVLCYIKNEAQLNFLLEKSKGDVVVIKGKVKSIGEILGYSIDIHEIS